MIFYTILASEYSETNLANFNLTTKFRTNLKVGLFSIKQVKGILNEN